MITRSFLVLAFLVAALTMSAGGQGSQRRALLERAAAAELDTPHEAREEGATTLATDADGRRSGSLQA